MKKDSGNIVTKVKGKMTPKRIAIIMAIVSLVSFLYKFVLGVLTPSALLIVASLPTAFVFLCKAMYAKHMDATRKQKKTAYLVMTIGTLAFAVLFFLFSSFTNVPAIDDIVLSISFSISGSKSGTIFISAPHSSQYMCPSGI